MAVVASKHIFGGGVYSTTHSRRMKIVGRSERKVSEIRIQPAKRRLRTPKGVARPAIVPPFMPKKMTDPFHPGGNSLCYMLQVATLMGCEPIYLLGFTLQTGTGYFFGMNNPVTRRRSLYEAEIPLHWLTWYQKEYPGRALLWPGWQGPVYEVLDVARDVEP